MPESKEHIHHRDQQLWSDFRNGSHDSFTIIIQHYFQPMFTYAIRLNKDPDFVKDCIQDVFYDLWRSRENISQADSVKSYLFATLRFKIYRERKKWNSFDELTDDYDFDSEITIETKIIDDQNTSELKRKIEAVLNKMPPRQREILYLRFYENLDHTRIAEVMGLNQQVIYNLLHKALVRLRKDWFVFMILFYSFSQKKSVGEG